MAEKRRYRCLVVRRTERQRWVTVEATSFEEASELAKEAAGGPENDASKWGPTLYAFDGVLRMECLGRAR